MAGTWFVVSRVNWSRGDRDGEYVRYSGGRPLASFPTWAAAEADRDKRERLVRKTVNPFRCGPALHYLSSLDDPRLRDWLLDHDIDPPADADWPAWWAAVGKKLPARGQAAVWQALDRVRFHTVEERPAGPVVYAVVSVEWEYNDEWHFGYPGEPVVAFRSRERAEAEAEARTVAARDEWTQGDPELVDQIACDPSYLTDDAAGPFARRQASGYGENLKPLSEVPLFEVVELEWEGA